MIGCEPWHRKGLTPADAARAKVLSSVACRDAGHQCGNCVKHALQEAIGVTAIQNPVCATSLRHQVQPLEFTNQGVDR